MANVGKIGKTCSRKCIEDCFLTHPAVVLIETIVRKTKTELCITSPYFVPGLHISFSGVMVDVWLVVKGSISDCMGDYSCTPKRIGPKHFINADCLTFYDKANGNKLTERPIAELQKYESKKAVYQTESLDRLIKAIECGKLLQAIEWKDWGDSAAAHFEGYPLGVGNTGTQWLYPTKRLVKPAGLCRNDKPVSKPALLKVPRNFGLSIGAV